MNNSISMMKGRCLLLLRYLQNGVGCFLLYELYLFFWNEWYIKQYMCVYLFVLDFVSVCIYNKGESTSKLRRMIDLPAWFQEFWPQPEWQPCFKEIVFCPSTNTYKTCKPDFQCTKTAVCFKQFSSDNLQLPFRVDIPNSVEKG